MTEGGMSTHTQAQVEAANPNRITSSSRPKSTSSRRPEPTSSRRPEPTSRDPNQQAAETARRSKERMERKPDHEERREDFLSSARRPGNEACQVVKVVKESMI